MSPLRLFLKQAQPSTCATSTVTTNGITISHGGPKLSKAPFGVPLKASPASAIMTKNTSIVGLGFQPGDCYRYKEGFLKQALSKVDATMKTTVIPRSRALLSNSWDITCYFFGYFPNPDDAILAQIGRRRVVPQLPVPVTTPSSSSSTVTSIPTRTPTFNPETFKVRSRASATPQSPLVSLAQPSRLARKRIFSPFSINNTVSYFKEFEHKDSVFSRDAKVTFELGPTVSTFITTDPPNACTSVPTSPTRKGLLKAPRNTTLPTVPEWQDVNFRCYESLTRRVFESLESNKSLSVNDLNSQLGTLYRILQKEVFDKVKNNCLTEGQRVSRFTSSMAAIQARTKGLFAELHCINDLFESNADPYSTFHRLNECLRQIDALEKHFLKIVGGLQNAVHDSRHKTLNIYAEECKKLNKMVFTRHFNLTESREEFEGSYVNIPDRISYRKTLGDITRLVPDASEFYLPNQLKRAEKAAYEASRFISSIKGPAQSLYNLLHEKPVATIFIIQQ